LPTGHQEDGAELDDARHVTEEERAIVLLGDVLHGELFERAGPRRRVLSHPHRPDRLLLAGHTRVRRRDGAMSSRVELTTDSPEITNGLL